MKQLLLSDREQVALKKCLEIYIRLGLGQLNHIGSVLGQLNHIGSVLDELNDEKITDHDDVEELKLRLSEADNLVPKSELQDDTTHSFTIAAFGIQAKLNDNHSAWEWACKRLHEKGNEVFE
jgi:hypothetical protein